MSSSTSVSTLAGLSLAEKRMLLAQLLQERASQQSRSAAEFPLSHGQRGLWFLYQMDRHSAAYNVCYPSRIRSRINLDALRRALQTFIERHPAARTTFEERDGDLIQRVHESIPLPLEVIDASTWSEETLRQRFEAEAHRPFDLEHGPLLRMHLFTIAPDDHVFLLGVHHIIGDFWSLVLVIEEMQALYPAACQGLDANLPTPGRTYADFVRWQTEMLRGDEGERLWTYWKTQLADAPTVLDLPVDRPRPAVFSQRGGAAPWRIDADLGRRLKALAVSEGVTLYTVLLAAFQVLMGRYTGQTDFLIGSPFAGRNRPGFEQVIGYFINMLPIRADLAGDPSFRTLLRRCGATVLDAMEHQDFPFSLMVERLNLTRDLSRAPLIQVSFTLEKSHRTGQLGAWRFFLPPSGARLEVGGLQMEQYYVEQNASQSDLEMVFEEGDGTLEGMLRFNIDLFEKSTAERMVGHFLGLLGGIADDPDRPISALPFLSDAERGLVLTEWNATDAEFSRDFCLHHLFERQASRTPEAIAVSGDGVVLTYAELNARANRLAHRLVALGARPNTFVALCLERSPAMIVAILGTLKAGAAYVPIDPATHAGRIELILSDTQAPVLLTQRNLVASMPAGAATVVCADEEFDENDDFTPETGVKSGDLAYVIYTSGSTGRPKGVMVEHRAIGNTLSWRARDIPMRPDDRILFNLPYTFDPTLCILFPAFAAGARIVLAAPGEEYDPRRLLQRVARERVTILEGSPALLWIMLDLPALDACRSLRAICCGGEAMPPDLPPRLLARLNVDLYNLYGPTEASVETTWWVCRRDDPRPSVPIGRPIANTRTYVLDAAMRPVPPGLPGEIYIGGAGLARGYLNDPALTARRFVPDPFGGEPGARIYRTGDRGRWLADGALEFLGRLDQQVKVRGFRVELGEVENALMSHPALRETAVVARPASDGHSRLIAYVVARESANPPTADDLHHHLKSRLPDSMVPGAFVALPTLPRTSVGKLDRAALPEPPSERPATARPFVAPGTPLETFLAGLWREVLRIDRVGVDDQFFELGGNSIQGAVLINRLQEQIGEPVDVVALFDAPTIRGLARHLGQVCPEAIARQFGRESLRDDPGEKTSRAAASPLVAIQPEGSEPPIFMVHPPGGIIVCYQALAHRLSPNRPFYGLRARGLQGEETLPETMEAMAEDYVAAIRQVQPVGPYRLGGWSVGGLVALEMAQQLRAEGESIALLTLLDSTPPASPDDDLSGKEYGLDVSLEALARFAPDEQLPYLWEHALKIGLIEPEVPMQVARQVLDELKRLFHHHMSLANNYVPRYYSGRITLFRPLEAPFAVVTTPDRGWGKLAEGVDVHFVPGQHHSMVKEPHVQSLARVLDACLERSS